MQKSPERVDTLVVSDIHLGSELSLTPKLLEALRTFDFKRLILNGDIFDHLDFGPATSTRLEKRRTLPYTHRLQESHFELLRYLRELAAKGTEVVWIEGNHDEGISKLFFALLGVAVNQEYSWEHSGKRYLALHGDQFDTFYREHRLTSDAAWAVYVFLQGLGPSARKFCRVLKLLAKRYIGAQGHVRKGALAFARERGADVVLCGHTHIHEIHNEGGLTYVNSGSWTESPCHLVSIGSELRIHTFTFE